MAGGFSTGKGLEMVNNAQIWLEFPLGWYTPIMVAIMLVLAVSQLLEPATCQQIHRVPKEGRNDMTRVA